MRIFPGIASLFVLGAGVVSVFKIEKTEENKGNNSYLSNKMSNKELAARNVWLREEEEIEKKKEKGREEIRQKESLHWLPLDGVVVAAIADKERNLIGKIFHRCECGSYEFFYRGVCYKCDSRHHRLECFNCGKIGGWSTETMFSFFLHYYKKTEKQEEIQQKTKQVDFRTLRVIINKKLE